MSDAAPWLTKAQIMAELKRGERTVQMMVRDGRLERRVGADKRSYYRVAQQVAAPQRDTAEPPPWAVELLEEIRALRRDIEEQRTFSDQKPTLRLLTPSPPESEALEVNTPPRNESQRRSDPQRPLWKRLLGIA